MNKKINKKSVPFLGEDLMKPINKICNKYSYYKRFVKYAFEFLKENDEKNSKTYERNMDEVIRLVFAGFYYRLRNNKRRQRFCIDKIFGICEGLFEKTNNNLYNYRNRCGLFMVLFRRIKTAEQVLKPAKSLKKGATEPLLTLHQPPYVAKYLFPNMKEFEN